LLAQPGLRQREPRLGRGTGAGAGLRRSAKGRNKKTKKRERLADARTDEAKSGDTPHELLL
jgi:hypothetical protein